MVAMVGDKNKAKAQAKENEASNERASDKRVSEEKAAVKEDNAADEAEKAEVKKGNDEVKGAKKLNNAGVTAQLAASAVKSKAAEAGAFWEKTAERVRNQAENGTPIRAFHF